MLDVLDGALAMLSLPQQAQRERLRVSDPSQVATF
jgi:hypothetical protein